MTAERPTGGEERARPQPPPGARVQAVFESISDPVAVLEAIRDEGGSVADWTFADANPAALALAGLRREELIGRRLSQLCPERLREDHAALREVLATGAPRVQEAEAGGRAMLVRCFRVDADAVGLAARDVTVYRQAADALREQLALRDQLARLAESVPGVICTFRLRTDGTALLVFATPAIHDLFGVPRAAIAEDAAAWATHVHPDDLARVVERVAESARTLGRYHDAYRYLHPTKGLRWIEGWAVPRAEGAQGTLWHGFLTDVTEQKQLEEVLRGSERKLREVVRATRGGYFEHSTASSSGLVTPRFAEILGFAPEELPPTTELAAWLAARLHPDDVPGAAELAEAYRSGAVEAVERELRIQAKDGSWRWVRLVASAITRDGSGRPELTAGLLFDITRRKRAEEALRASDRRKSDFLAVLSHELRNPLTPLRSSAYLLDRAPPGSPQAVRAREVIHRQVDHLTRLVSDLLDVTRIDVGKVVLERTRLDAREVVQRSCDDARSTFEERGIFLRVELGPAPLWVDADATRLAQITGNLLANASKYTPPQGQVVVTLRDEEGACALRVRDTGAGIDPELLEAIFEPFAQAERTRGKARGGIGIGLHLVRSLVELHGGSVRALSAGSGQGAELVVRLPLAAPPDAPMGAAAEEARPGLSVLVVEDNPDAAETLADVLRLLGHRVRVALDGADGVSAFREQPAEVLLCDVGLPDTSGYEVVRRIRELPGGAAAFAGALTGYTQPEDVRRAREAGFDAHLAKPPSIEQLSRLLEDAAARRR